MSSGFERIVPNIYGAICSDQFCSFDGGGSTTNSGRPLPASGTMFSMSWVCNVLVSFDIEDRVAIEGFSAWLASEAPCRDGIGGRGVGQLGDLVGEMAPAWAGPKYPECRLWGGALNHADLEAVVAKFGELPWRAPAAAQLFLMDQEQSYFRLWMIRDGRMDQYAPEPPKDDSAW